AACVECDDGDAAVNPGATETCNTVDDDCDGTADEDEAVDARPWYLDADADGYGDDATALTTCEAPAGYAERGGDCDDADAAFNPSALEEDCTDPADYNCDGSVGYADADADGWAACEDCDDTNGDVRPDGVEVCNAVDDDCDGTPDEDATDAPAWFVDADADGYGDAAVTALACTVPDGFVAADDDCDDADAGVSPSAVEACNDRDDDCDLAVDEADAADAGRWFRDADGDGHGDAADTLSACGAPAGYVATADDCDDTRASVRPGAVETCDEVDQDCDGTADEDAADVATFHLDLDGDGYGDPVVSAVTCERPDGYVVDATDCDDAAAAAFPGADETCDDLDNDCDGGIDEADALDADTWYADADLDGFGDADVGETACAAPAGFVADASDCDDALAGVFPGAAETCDAIDQDCDAVVDEDATDATTFFADTDGDGFGEAGST
ncbi:MAG: putative metal-binding motif-containing protein, partial [Myxococcota bacterium]